MKKNNKCSLCGPDCIYFPSNADKNISFVIKNNVKVRDAPYIYFCNFDGHVLVNWEFCNNKKTYKDIKKRR